MTALERIAVAACVVWAHFALRVDDASRPWFALAALPVIALAWAALYFRWLAGHSRTVTVKRARSHAKCAVRDRAHRSPLVLTALQASKLTPGHSDETPIIYERVA